MGKHRNILLATLALLLAASAAPAQTFPSKTVRIIVPFAAGGANDVVGRALAERLSSMWGKGVIVENRAGAATVIGTRAVIDSTPDGHTLLFTSSTALVVSPHISEQRFNAIEQLEPVTMVVTVTPGLAVSKNTPAKNLDELLSYAKANPGKLTYASLGVGSYTHVAFEYLKKMAGVDFLHVPYNGTAPVITDMLAGRINMFMVALNVFEEYEANGDLKILGVATERKLARRPDLAPIAESVPGFDLDVWFGLAAPKKTSEAILDRIHEDVASILKSESFRNNFLRTQGYEASSLSRKEFIEKVNTDFKTWGAMIESTGIVASRRK